MKMNMNMKYSTKIEGIITPVITPLTEKAGLDEGAYRKLIDSCIDNGVSGIFSMGSSGEALRVPRETWRASIRTAVEAGAGRIHVFCGAIAAGTYETIENILEAEQMGAQYVVATAPFYLQNSGQDEIIRHFYRICAATKIKVVAYNIPSMVHVNIMPETIREIATIDNIVAYKDSAADWEQFQRNLFLLEDCDMFVFNGAEELCGAALLFGADGCVPGLSSFFPKLFVDLYKAARAGQIKTVYALQRQIWHLRKSLFVGKHWMSSMKALASMHGFGANISAFPIETLTEAQTLEIQKILAQKDCGSSPQ